MYPKSTQDEARFPCTGSRAIPCSTSYTSGLTSFRKLQRFPETPVSSLEQHQFQHSNSRKFCAPHIISRWELIPWLRMKNEAIFWEAPLEEASLSKRYVRGTLVLLSQVEWTPRCPDSKEGQISLQWLECTLVFHLTRWRDVWISCGDHRESPRCPPHLDRRPHIPLTPREGCRVQRFRRWRCMTLLENW